MGVRGTENFIYYTDRPLGSGSTGTVYYGRHKRKGDMCAVKIFSRISSRQIGLEIARNELDFMRRLRHQNIVSLLAIEKDLKSGDNALVMELCVLGSLYKLLQEPHNYFGLLEPEFLSFLYQFCDGLGYLRVHGITHRDIKPANILCTKTEHGNIWYKITDFGASKELLSESSLRSVFGTEEYLHPDTYRYIFIDKKSVGQELELRSELWSIGVTLYQVATGKLPFVVSGGRKNKQKMFQLISKKSSGVINGSQKENSDEFEYFDVLPRTCCLSEGLMSYMVPILSGLMESDHSKQWHFEKFLPAVEKIKSLKMLCIFDVFSMVFHRIYIGQISKFIDIKKELCNLTGIVEKNQLFIVCRRRIEAADDDPISQVISESKGETIIFLPTEYNNYPVKTLYIPNPPKMTPEKTIQDDYFWCLGLSAWCNKVVMRIEEIIKKQITVLNLPEKLIHIVNLLHTSLELMEHHFIKIQNVHNQNVLRNIEELKKIHVNISLLSISTANMCSYNKCLGKAQNISKQSKEVTEDFGEDRKKVLSHNDEQIHKYKRSKLEEKMIELQDLYQKHCDEETQQMAQVFKKWYSYQVMAYLKKYNELEREIFGVPKTGYEIIMDELKKKDEFIEVVHRLVDDKEKYLSRLLNT